jgi:hypothetical protein
MVREMSVKAAIRRVLRALTGPPNLSQEFVYAEVRVALLAVAHTIGNVINFP